MSRRRKGSETDLKTEKGSETEVSTEKIFFLALSDVADILSAPPKIRKGKPDKRPIRAKILHGESFPERDQVIRSLAVKAYDVANLMENNGDYEGQLKWMKLVARLLSVSLEPKKLAELEEIKKALAEIKRQRETMK